MKIDVRPSGVALHFEKHKANGGEVNGLARHNERQPGGHHSNENIDDSRTGDNIFLIQDDRKLADRVADRIEAGRTAGRGHGLVGVRKDAVRMVEGTVQLSGKVLDRPLAEQVAVLRDSFAYMENTFGADNFVSAVIHLDETTPHLHFDFVPLEDGRLDAKHIIGPERLKAYQDGFLKHLQEVNPRLKFERGSGETNGMTYEAFKALEEAKKQAEAEADARDDELDDREAELDAREGEADKLKAKAQAAAKRTKAIADKYKADRVAEGDQALTEAKARAAAIATSSTGKTQAELDAQEAADAADRQKWVADFNSKVEGFNSEVAKLHTAQQDVASRETAVGTRENAVRGREEAVTAREAKAATDAKEAAEKLAEAQQEREEAATLLEAAKAQADKLLADAKEAAEALRKRLAASWQRVLDMVRAGDLKPAPVEKVAEKYDPVTEATAPALAIDLDKLVEKSQENAQGRSL